MSEDERECRTCLYSTSVVAFGPEDRGKCRHGPEDRVVYGDHWCWQWKHRESTDLADLSCLQDMIMDRDVEIEGLKVELREAASKFQALDTDDSTARADFQAGWEGSSWWWSRGRIDPSDRAKNLAWQEYDVRRGQEEKKNV